MRRAISCSQALPASSSTVASRLSISEHAKSARSSSDRLSAFCIISLARSVMASVYRGCRSAALPRLSLRGRKSHHRDLELARRRQRDPHGPPLHPQTKLACLCPEVGSFPSVPGFPRLEGDRDSSTAQASRLQEQTGGKASACSTRHDNWEVGAECRS